MPSAHPAMDGGNSFPQHQQPGDAVCSIPGLRSQLAVPGVEVRPCRSWGRGEAVPRRGLGRALQPGRSWESWSVFVAAISRFPRQLLLDRSEGLRLRWGGKSTAVIKARRL